MPKQFVTIKGNRVPVSSITSEARPFPFSKAFHKLSISELQNDIIGNDRNLQQFRRNLELNRESKAQAFTKKSIKELQAKNLRKIKEIKNRQSKAKTHRLRFGKG